ncbi:MAG TPA: endo-1,4-beta-xylanase [Tepidisphaeraceae bacterium]
MTRLLACALSMFGLFFVCTTFADTPAKPTTLRQAADKDHLLIGTAVNIPDLNDPRRAALIANQFNCLTPGNEFKPDFLQRVKGQFTFGDADKLVAFAEAHNMQIIGHNLCWHNQTPAWMYANPDGTPLSREAALANLKTHIDTVVKHFKGKVIGWDVVNEAISDSPNEYLRNTPARKAIGDDFVEQAFRLAHEADPNVKLFYNDYNIDIPYKRDHAIRLIQELKARGVRIDGVGIQGHYLLNWPDPKMLDDAITAYAALGVKVMISEMDIDVLPRQQNTAEITATEKAGLDPYKNGIPPEILQQQAKRYGDFFAVMMKHRDVVSRVTIWGVDDGSSWLNNFPTVGRTNYPLLWDRQFQPKPAFDAVLKQLTSVNAAQ